MSIDKSHGSPYDRGDSDAYYGRRPSPHKWTFENAKPGTWIPRTRVEDLTEEEIREYNKGYDENPSDRKDWR